MPAPKSRYLLTCAGGCGGECQWLMHGRDGVDCKVRLLYDTQDNHCGCGGGLDHDMKLSLQKWDKDRHKWVKAKI